MRVAIELTDWPSSGYVWEPSQEPDEKVYLDSDEPDDGELRYGGEVTTKFVFNDVPAGTDLTFSHHRRWNKNEPKEVVYIHVG